LFFTKNSLQFERHEGWLLSLAGIALLIVPFLSDEYRFIAMLVVIISFICFDLLAHIAVLGMSGDFGEQKVIVFALSRAINTFGVCLGWSFGYLILQTGSIDETLLLYLILALVALVIVGRNVVRRRGLQNNDTQTTSRPYWKDACRSVAQYYHLSEKEQEVFMYLAKGRNSVYISEQLVLSNHTIKSHIYRIYQKTGVHSQQELIDLIEKWNSH
jgi:DNA-binding NarL/FixJ family response regulator